MDPPFSAYDYATDKQPFVFVSYAHADAQQIYPIIKQLHEKGIKIWYDEGIEASSEWMAKIADAIKNCTTFITFLSNSSIQRNNVKREISFALKRYDNNKLQFIPIYLEEMTLPEELDLALGPIQALMKHKLNDAVFFTKLHSSIIGVNGKGEMIPQTASVEEEKRQADNQQDRSGDLNVEIYMDYHGVPLATSDYGVLMDIEKEMGPIPDVEQVKVDTFGYLSKNGRVTALCLSDGQLSSLPKSIGNLASLQTLYLQHNLLKLLPKSIGKLVYLQTLDLSSNQLTSLPESICHLISLQYLNLSNNQLTSLPEGINNLRALQTLDLSSNQLTSLPEGIRYLSLQYLNLADNPFPDKVKKTMKKLILSKKIIWE